MYSLPLYEPNRLRRVFSSSNRGILAAAKRLSIKNHFIWVASDGWGRQHKLVEGLEDVAEGALTVELQSSAIPGFEEYMLSRTPYNNKRNVWYEEFWEDVFGCVLPHKLDVRTRQSTGSHGNITVCSPTLRLTPQFGYDADSKTQFVVDGVYAFAHALAALQRDVCGRKKGACPALLSYDGGDFYSKYLLNVSFLGKPADACVPFCRFLRFPGNSMKFPAPQLSTRVMNDQSEAVLFLRIHELLAYVQGLHHASIRSESKSLDSLSAYRCSTGFLQCDYWWDSRRGRRDSFVESRGSLYSGKFRLPVCLLIDPRVKSVKKLSSHHFQWNLVDFLLNISA